MFSHIISFSIQYRMRKEVFAKTFFSFCCKLLGFLSISLVIKPPIKLEALWQLLSLDIYIEVYTHRKMNPQNKEDPYIKIKIYTHHDWSFPSLISFPARELCTLWCANHNLEYHRFPRPPLFILLQTFSRYRISRWDNNNVFWSFRYPSSSRKMYKLS